MDLNTSERNVTARSFLMLELVDFQKFMFSDRYHLTVSALAGVCSLMMRLMLWINFFNHYRTSLLLSLLNVFLKVRAVYFTVDSTTSGAFQCSACSAGAPATCTSSTINLLGVDSPFSDEVGPSRAVWHNFYLAGCSGAFLQLLKCFSKLLVQLKVLPQLGISLFWWEVHSVLLELSFIGEESTKPLAFVFGVWCSCICVCIFHRLLNLSRLLVSRCKHDFELIIS